MIDVEHPVLSIERQCALVGLGRSSLYYHPCGQSARNLRLMRMLDEQYTRRPFYGVRRMTEWLCRAGEIVNRKRVRRLMRRMGLEAIYPKRRLSVPGEGRKRYPYLLRGVAVERPDQVWSADITYIRLHSGFAYWVAILDWYSRYVLSWALSVDLGTEFCMQALEEALRGGRPEIFNTDQGAQFTSDAFTGRLEAEGIGISMDGRGRVFDNIFIERLWRSVKTEEVYIKDYADPKDARQNLGMYLGFYNHERLHQALGYCPPAEVYHNGTERKRGCATARAVGGTPVALRAPSVPPTAN